MSKTGEPWKASVNSRIPNRSGDSDPTAIFCALGRAVSAWEGVNAAVASLYRALVEDKERQGCEPPAVEAFGGLDSVHRRAKQLSDETKRFAAGTFGVTRKAAAVLRHEVEQELAAYRGWAERRNELAHGYVTEAEGPDYSQEDQPLVKSHSLCPSHARTGKWRYAEPEYNYVSAEIDIFADQFGELDERLEALAERVEALRAKAQPEDSVVLRADDVIQVESVAEIIVCILDETYDAEVGDEELGTEVERSKRFKREIEREFGLTFREVDVFPGASLPAFLTSILEIQVPLWSFAAAAFFMGKPIRENLDAWVALASRIKRFFSRKVVLGRTAAAVVALDAVFERIGSLPKAVTLAGYQTRDTRFTEGETKSTPDAIAVAPAVESLAAIGHVFDIDADGLKFQVTVIGKSIEIRER